MEHVWTALASVVVGVLGGGSLLRLLQWLFKGRDADRDEWRKERRQFIARLEKKIDHLEERLEERGDEMTALIAENLKLKARLGELGEECP